jgi:hypothetical protein
MHEAIPCQAACADDHLAGGGFLVHWNGHIYLTSNITLFNTVTFPGSNAVSVQAYFVTRTIV